MFESLYKDWTRLGVGFDESFSMQGIIDLEQTIMATVQAGRNDSRLLFGLRGWFLKHHDLVNGARLARYVQKAKETAVLGAIIDSVIEEHPRSVLVSVKRYCKKFKKKGFLFHRIAQSKLESTLNQQENHPIWNRWNLISNEMSDMEGAIFEKAYVLKHNPNLALRAFFGAGTRAEIFSYFLKNKSGNALEISHALNQSYQPVYAELTTLCRIGLGKVRRKGVGRIFTVSPRLIKALLRPFAVSV